MENIVSVVKKHLPPFNDALLEDFRKDQINNSIEFISNSFREAAKILRNIDVEYLNYRIYTPEERFNIEINENIIKKSVNIRKNEFILVGFDFKCQDKLYTINLYIPYLFEDFIIVNNTKYSIHFSFIERTFSIIKNGISIKVIQSPLLFDNKLISSIKSIDGNEYFDVIITTTIHRKNRKKRRKEIPQTIINYLLARYGFYETIRLFGFNKNQLDFVSTIGDDRDKYEYFQIKKESKDREGIYMKADAKLIKDNSVFRKVAIGISFILQSFKKYELNNIVGPNNAEFFKFLLGKIIHGRNVHKIMIYEYMNRHFHSLMYYLDTLTKERFRSNGINFNDIFDLLVYVFINFDKIKHEFKNNNLYKKKVDVFQIILSKILIEKIYKNFYDFENSNNTRKENYIKGLFRISPRQITKMYNMQNVRLNTAYYNDNKLLGIFSHVVKNFNTNTNPTKSGKGKGKGTVNLNSSYSYFHYSIPVVESLVGFSSSNPTASCIINPYCQINPDGGFVETEEAKELRKIQKHLHTKKRKDNKKIKKEKGDNV